MSFLAEEPGTVSMFMFAENWNHILVWRKDTVSNLALVGYNKLILYAAVGAQGRTHDARMLKNIQLYLKTLEGGPIQKLNICLGAGTVPMVTFGDSAFPQHL